jgi:hypothetical protein
MQMIKLHTFLSRDIKLTRESTAVALAERASKELEFVISPNTVNKLRSDMGLGNGPRVKTQAVVKPVQVLARLVRVLYEKCGEAVPPELQELAEAKLLPPSPPA